MEAAKAILAYAQAQKRDLTDAAGGGAAPSDGPRFGEMVQAAIQDGIETAKTGESTAAAGLSGEAALVDVVTAISAAEVTVQTAVAVRDKVISAYQEIMRMPI